MDTNEEELARQIWELGMKDPPAQKQDGYQCLSVWDGFRCIMTERHVGEHRAIYVDQNGTRTRRLKWTDADIGPQAPPAIDIAAVVTDIRALLTEVTGALTESNRLLAGMRGDLGEFLTRTGETEAERAKAAQDRISAMEKTVRERLGLVDREDRCTYVALDRSRCILKDGHSGRLHKF